MPSSIGSTPIAGTMCPCQRYADGWAYDLN